MTTNKKTLQEREAAIEAELASRRGTSQRQAEHVLRSDHRRQPENAPSDDAIDDEDRDEDREPTTSERQAALAINGNGHRQWQSEEGGDESGARPSARSTRQAARLTRRGRTTTGDD